MRLSPILLATLVACAASSSSRRDRWLTGEKAADVASRKLTADEQRVVDKHGFAILAGGEVPSFHIGYTALFHAHQPVYITADSLLYAWHHSYDKILREVEETHLIPQLTKMLEELREHLAAAQGDAQTRADVDVYLTVAHALLVGKSAPVAGGDAQAISALVAQGTSAEGSSLALLGDTVDFDFTMFKPRGHYTASDQLERYFRSMSWLGRVELRIADQKDGKWVVSRRAFAAARMLASLFEAPGSRAREKWNEHDATIGAFVGPPDSMSLPGLAAGMAALGTSDRDEDIIAALGKHAAQRIRTQMRYPGPSAIAFVMLGQRFVFDAEVLTDVSYGGLPIKRMMPSTLDVAHAVMHNPAARPLLAKELEAYAPSYPQALDAARKKSTEAPELWTGSLYHLWLGALRGLSPDATRDAKLPAPLSSDAWARRMMSTQLASWAELRHDNLLYAKQSVTAMAICEYPTAYVDPYPAFYAGMEAIATRAQAALGRFATKTMLAYFENMRTTMARLRKIAQRERDNVEIQRDDLDWINRMVSIDGRSAGCTTIRVPEGWHADLYYDRSRILYHEAIVADVHTQPTDAAGNTVGHVLHVGTGFPRMMVTKLEHDGGKNRQTYRGFVSTYSEMITKDFSRLTDEVWQAEVHKVPPPPPAWLEPVIAN